MGLLDAFFKSASRAIGREVGKKAVNAVSDMLDGSDEKKKKTASGKKEAKKEEPEKVEKVNANISASSPLARASSKVESEYDTTPDMPREFLNATGWLCIKNATPQKVIKVLGLKNDQRANWESGLKAIYEGFMEKVFVSPLINGYVLVIGYIPFGVKKTVKEELSVLDKLAEEFEEMSCFTTQDTVDIHVWAKYVSGKMKRGYGWLGESGVVYLNEGNLTPEEHKLGFTNLITDTECDWEKVDFPDVEHVHAMAKIWGIAPDLSDIQLPEADTGYVCEL